MKRISANARRDRAAELFRKRISHEHYEHHRAIAEALAMRRLWL